MSHKRQSRKHNARQKRNTNVPGEQTDKSTQEQPNSASASGKRSSRQNAARARARKKRQMQMLLGGLAAVVALVALVVLINRPGSDETHIDYSDVEVAQSSVIVNPGTLPGGVVDGEISFATGVTVGDPDAPVTMHIFSDFQCYFCKVFHDETLPLIMDDFVRTGQLKLVFHDFPRLGTDAGIADPNDFTIELADTNNESSVAAQAAMCSSEQDAYLEMSDRLFANYRGVQSGSFDRADVDTFASDLGLDGDTFKACMDSQRHVPALAGSVEQGAALGITGTPMFILDNGSGNLNVVQQTAEGYDLLKRQIEASIQTAP